MKEFHEELHRYRFVIWFLVVVFGLLVVWGPQTTTLKPVGRMLFALFFISLICYYGSMYAMYKLMQNPVYVKKIRTEEILRRRYYSERIYEEAARLKALEDEDRKELKELEKIQ